MFIDHFSLASGPVPACRLHAAYLWQAVCLRSSAILCVWLQSNWKPTQVVHPQRTAESQKVTATVLHHAHGLFQQSHASFTLWTPLDVASQCMVRLLLGPQAHSSAHMYHLIKGVANVDCRLGAMLSKLSHTHSTLSGMMRGCLDVPASQQRIHAHGQYDLRCAKSRGAGCYRLTLHPQSAPGLHPSAVRAEQRCQSPGSPRAAA